MIPLDFWLNRPLRRPKFDTNVIPVQMLPRWSDEDAPLQSEAVKAPFIVPTKNPQAATEAVVRLVRANFSSFIMLNEGPESGCCG